MFSFAHHDMLVIGEGREGKTQREGEVYIYKYRENIKTKRDIQRKREARTHAPDIKRCTLISYTYVYIHTHGEGDREGRRAEREFV